MSEDILARDGDDTPAERATVAAMEADLADLRDWRSAIVQAVLFDNEDGHRVLTLAGGTCYGANGRAVNLQSGGMAARAARYMWGKRGHIPSDTSLQEAAAAAAAAIWFHWCGLQAVDCAVWSPSTMRHLGAMGWRAAFKSFRGDASQGRTGSRSDE